MKRTFRLLSLLWSLSSLTTLGQTVEKYDQPYRPQIHFSPKAHWMNDPNGMVYLNNTYHLYFQYYPKGTTWGPMHWGHATSKDLMRWEEQPIALYPDKLGYIFSGSAVADLNNTSGFGRYGIVPLVAIFTSHDPVGEKQGKSNFQTQSIAYSLDGGKTWDKYEGNPVLRNPGITDFRDPKVNWYKAGKKWVMTLATKDRITFYSSPDLKSWSKESEFGEGVGGHGGVWECPDLFPLTLAGKTYWVLIVNINPGGPNGGSATQYFIGDFDGSKFTPLTTEIKWLDYGPDEYAGVTWSNTGDRRIFLGWMSNWQYANQVPTDPWRSAMTIPRDLSLRSIDGNYFLCSQPVKEIDNVVTKELSFKNLLIKEELDLSQKVKSADSLYMIKFSAAQLQSFALVLSNDAGEEAVIGYDRTANQYYFDRTRSGKIDFEKGFGKRLTAPRISKDSTTDITLIVDLASAELFADKGLTVMTGIFFPTKSFNRLTIRSKEGLSIDRLTYSKMKSAWNR